MLYEAIAILAIVVLNACWLRPGSRRAEICPGLMALAAPEANVVATATRAGRDEEIVPGDTGLVEAGEKIPADAGADRKRGPAGRRVPP